MVDVANMTIEARMGWCKVHYLVFVVFRFAEVMRYGNLQKLWCFDGANALKISR
jgi:hypothetical protein